MFKRLATAIVVTSLSGPAAAQELRFGWCEAEDADGNYVLSGLMDEKRAASRDAIKREFAAGVGMAGDIECSFYAKNEVSARSDFSYRQYVIRTNEKRSFRLSGWVGAYGIAGEVPAPPGGGYLSVEENKGAKAASDQFRDAVLRAQRDEAAQRARNLASTIRMQSESRARLAKFIEMLRKRGSAQ